MKTVFSHLKNFFSPLAIVFAISVAGFSSGALAHFQLLFAAGNQREAGSEITLKMPFAHPATSGHVMEMARPEEFYLVHKGKKTDLMDRLSVIPWTSAENTGKAYQAKVKLRGLGDHVFVLVPAPYYEEAEGIYIQQLTKAYVNIGGLPGDWDKPQALKAEILPLIAPYNVMAGSTFSGVVLKQGKPVPHAEIEVEYMNYPPDPKNNAFRKEAVWKEVALSIHADGQGCFTLGLPKQGYWGFAALGVGPDAEFRGKELSQDAVIWVEAR